MTDGRDDPQGEQHRIGVAEDPEDKRKRVPKKGWVTFEEIGVRTKSTLDQPNVVSVFQFVVVETPVRDRQRPSRQRQERYAHGQRVNDIQ